MVFGSLLEVADHRAMEIADLGQENADLGPLYDQLVTERFSVVFCRSANAVRWFSVVGVKGFNGL